MIHTPLNLDFIYNSDEMNDRVLLAYSTSINKELRHFDLTKDKLAGTQLVLLAEKMNCPLYDLVDEKKANAHKLSNYKNLSNQELIKVINENQAILKSPILVVDDKPRFVNGIEDINRIDTKVSSAAESDWFQQ